MEEKQKTIHDYSPYPIGYIGIRTKKNIMLIGIAYHIEDLFDYKRLDELASFYDYYHNDFKGKPKTIYDYSPAPIKIIYTHGHNNWHYKVLFYCVDDIEEERKVRSFY